MSIAYETHPPLPPTPGRCNLDRHAAAAAAPAAATATTTVQYNGLLLLLLN